MPSARPIAASGRGLVVLALALFAGALLALHGSELRFPFVADDYLFLESAVAPGPGHIFGSVPLATNYFRPVGRELYFFTLARVFGPEAFPFHLFNFLVLLGTVVLVYFLARRWVGGRGALLAAGTYALFYPHRVSMAWVSCAQDLLATAAGTGAALLYVHGRKRVAALTFFVGLLAKESIAALPLVLFLWEAWTPARNVRERLSRAWRATAPLWVASAAWAIVVLVARSATRSWVPAGTSLPMADVALRAGSLWQGLRLALLTYFDVEQPLGYLGQALARTPAPWIAMALVAAGALVTLALRGGEEPRSGERPAWRLGLLWATVGVLPVALVGHHFSAYYVGFGAVGFALVAGWALSRVPAPAVAAIFAAFAWIGAGANAVEPFRLVREQQEKTGVSYVSIARLEWQRKFVEALENVLWSDPPARGSMIYLSHAPNYFELSTFGARGPRIWFRDPTLDLSYITHYERAGSRPSRIVRFDPPHWSFVALPNALVDDIVEGERTLEAGRPSEAKAPLARALVLASMGPFEVERVEIGNDYGLACYQTGDAEAARAAWMEVLRLDPDHRGALLNLAAWDAGRGHFEEAKKLTMRVLAQSAIDPMGLYYLSRLDRSLGNDAGSERAWNALATEQPAFADSVKRVDGKP